MSYNNVYFNCQFTIFSYVIVKNRHLSLLILYSSLTYILTGSLELRALQAVLYQCSISIDIGVFRENTYHTPAIYPHPLCAIRFQKNPSRSQLSRFTVSCLSPIDGINANDWSLACGRLYKLLAIRGCGLFS